MPVDLITVTGAGTWTPSGPIAALTVECWGSGGQGGSGTSGAAASGGGGAYSIKVFSGPFAGSYSVNVGAGNGVAKTWFSANNSAGCVADYGRNANNLTLGAGGLAANGFGDTKYGGGTGAAGSASTTYSASGGGGAGSTGAGNAGTAAGTSATFGGAAVADNGGKGGDGRMSGNAGQAGSTYGGGGAGGNGAGRGGGAGAQGLIRVTYTIAGGASRRTLTGMGV